MSERTRPRDAIIFGSDITDPSWLPYANIEAQLPLLLTSSNARYSTSVISFGALNRFGSLYLPPFSWLFIADQNRSGFSIYS